MGKAHPYQRRAIVATLVLTVIALAAYIGCRVAGEVFRTKLSAAVRNGLHADLQTGAVIYRPPFTFIAKDVRISRAAEGQPTQIVTAAGLTLRLARLPHKNAPLMIDRLILDRPVFHWTGQGEPTHAEATTSKSPLQSVERFSRAERQQDPPVRWSDKLRIAHLEVNDAQIACDDLKGAGRNLRLRHVQLDLHQANDPAAYQCRLVVSDGAALWLCAEAAINDDQMRVDLSRFSAVAQVGPAVNEIPLSDKQKRALAENAPDGKVTITGSAAIPLRDLHSATFQFNLDLDAGAVRVPRWKASVREAVARLTLHNGAPPADPSELPPLDGNIEHLELAAGRATLRLDGGTIEVQHHARTWRAAQMVGRLEMADALPFSPPRSGWFFDKGQFQGPVDFTAAASGPFIIPQGQDPLDAIHHELLAYPRGVSMRPRNFPLPIEHVTGGPIAFRGGAITFQNLAGTYGGDALLLRACRLTLEDLARHITLDQLKTQVKFEEIAGTIVFRQPNPPYPGAIGKTVAQLRPTGPFVVGAGSWYAVNRPPRDELGRRLKPDYFIHLLGDGGAFAVTDYRIPLTNVQGQATIAPLAIDIRDFRAAALDGTAWAEGRIVPGRPAEFQGRAEVRSVDMRQLAQRLPMRPQTRERLSGRGFASARISGGSSDPLHTAADKLVADGEFEILRGDFWSVPSVQEVAAAQLKQSDALGTGDAAGVVHIQNRVITLQNGAINSPLLGLQGSGTIGFDKSLNLSIVAAPLGNWRDKMRQLNVPVVSDVGGDILGAVQQLFNSAQGALLYQYRITGTTAHPIKNLVPAPAITEPLALLFGQMAGGANNGRLLNQIRNSSTQPAPPVPTAQTAGSRQSRS